MPLPSIYDQLGAALAQAAVEGQRSILYRGKVIPCVVLQGVESTALGHGGLQTKAVVHVKIVSSLLPIGQDGIPHENERVTYPATPTSGLIPFLYAISEVIPEEYAYSFTLVDPSQ